MRWHVSREGGHGRRAWFHLGGDRELFEARLEGYWLKGARHTGLRLEFDDEPPGLQVFAGLSHVLCFWLTLGSPALAGAVYRRWKRYLPELIIAGVKHHDRALWWEFWHPKHSWTAGTPRWRHGSLQWFDLLAGKPVYSSETTYGPTDVDVPMPEATYRARVTLHRDTWTRARWWPTVIDRGTIEVLDDDGNLGGYLPIPGKGENSWDCGGDGTYSMTGPCDDVRDLVDKLMFDTLRTRRQRNAPLTYAEPIR